MAFQIKCADGGSPCKFEVKTENKDELLKLVKLHVDTSHPEMARNPPPPEAINKLIHEV